MRRKLIPCRFMLFLTVAVSACSLDSGNEAASALNEFPSDLEARVEARLSGLDAITSIYAKHPPCDREIAIRADRPMNTLSVIKIPVMVQVFRDASSGRLDLGSRYAVEPGDMRRGSGLIQTYEPGLNPTLRGLVMQMIVTSDNAATDMVIDAVGMDRVNELLASEGYAETRLKATTGELFRHVWVLTDPENASMTDREVFKRGFPGDPEA